MAKLTTYLSGVAGEYFVAAELSRLGYLASLTHKNARDIDILVASPSGSRIISVQVKTNQGSGKRWLLDNKAEKLDDPNCFYVFVRLNGCEGRPSYHIVESGIVARYCKKGHRNWLAGQKKDGRARKDTPMRMFLDERCEYENAWKRLGLDG